MTRNIIFAILTALALLPVVTACEDNFEYRVNAIPEGYSEVAFDVDFKDFTPSLDSRAAGDAIKYIESLWIAIYNTDSTLYMARPLTEADQLAISTRPNQRPDGNPSSETTTGSASFKLVVPNGKYLIYAIANLDLNGRDISTPAKLRGVRLWWNQNKAELNNQMFGVFQEGNSEYTGGSETVEIAGGKTLHAWLRRCASKVTVAYDASKLKDGVSIYLMGVTIKDIPISCYLGAQNSPSHVDSLIHEGELIQYCKGNEDIYSDSFLNGYHATLSNKEGQRTFGSDHSDASQALFFYENMQGVHTNVDKTQQDRDKDGIPDNRDRLKDEVPCGSYIEVEAVYRSTNPQKPGNGIVIYRFMLGKDIYHDFDAERNHHYKLTLHLKGFANEYDWHVDYNEQILEVSNPKEYDYRGMVFMPERNLNQPNRGHVFSDSNTVVVRSYVENDLGRLEDYTISYKEEGATAFSSSCSWLEPVITEDGRFPYEKRVSFRVKPTRPDVKAININKKLSETANATKGKDGQPYNLANPSQTAVNPASATIQNTANCYIVDAPGYYLIPAVYGNAIKGGAKNTSAYSPDSKSGSKPLGNFVNHLGQNITGPYIVDHPGCKPARAATVLQDENNLLTYDNWAGPAENKNVKYIASAYGGKGGIQFYIDRDNIKQGNAVIGLVADDSHNIIVDAKLPVIWSWHIWVTTLSGIDEDERDISVTMHKEAGQATASVVDFMPMNLGWCSDADDDIKYYPERRCTVMFKAGLKTATIEIVQRSHIAIPCGNSCYYQWGRKDPFFGVLNNTADHNKPRYLFSYWSTAANYGALNGNQWSDDGRKKSIDALGDMVSYPYLWHNPPRKSPGYDSNLFQTVNETYSNLWGAGAIDNETIVKTVYDPCPVGYMIPHAKLFSGFTTTGSNTTYHPEWYDAQLKNISDYDTANNKWQANTKYTDNVYEVYTSPAKTQSMVFPISGYRDWDNGGYAFKFGEIGYVWSANECRNANTVSGGNYDNDNDWVYQFAFSRSGAFLRPHDIFFSVDGFPVRPVKM